jgi:hypothetical protein
LPGIKETTTASVRGLSGGSWSTLNLRSGLDRKGMEGFTITVLRSAVLELDAYCQQAGLPDNVDAFLGWIKTRRAATQGTAAS